MQYGERKKRNYHYPFTCTRERKEKRFHPARGGERERIQWEERKRREIYIASVGKKVNLRAGMAALGEE